MTQMSRRAQNRREKTSRILNAALAVFSDAGYSDSSMDAIAEKAGVTKPTLYQYFNSKSGLFKAMMAARKDAMVLSFSEAGDKDLVDQLLDFAWTYAGSVMHPDLLSLARLIIAEAHRFPDIGRDYQNSGPDQVLEQVMSFMTAQRAAGRLSFEEAELAAEDFWGLILSAPRNRALHVPTYTPGAQDLARYINNGLRVFLRAYSTRPEQDLARLQRAIQARDAQSPGVH